jgi:hypothetical protein
MLTAKRVEEHNNLSFWVFSERSHQTELGDSIEECGTQSPLGFHSMPSPFIRRNRVETKILIKAQIFSTAIINYFL